MNRIATLLHVLSWIGLFATVIAIGALLALAV